MWKLNVAVLDWPDSIDFADQKSRYQPEWIAVENENFEGIRVVVDNHQFRHCKFVRCTLIFSGGPFGFSECEVDWDSQLALTGAAMRGLLLNQALAQRPGIPGAIS
jgi:hypothetical protein